MSNKRPYNRDSIERALIHHGADYSPPEEGGRSTWLIKTLGIGMVQFTTPQAYAYVVGLADKERLIANKRTEAQQR